MGKEKITAIQVNIGFIQDLSQVFYLDYLYIEVNIYGKVQRRHAVNSSKVTGNGSH